MKWEFKDAFCSTIKMLINYFKSDTNFVYSYLDCIREKYHYYDIYTYYELYGIKL